MVLKLLEVDPSVLIGSQLVEMLPYEPFSWKRSLALYFFGFRKPINSLTKPLTNLACSSRTGEILTSGRFCTDHAALGPYRASTSVNIVQYGPRMHSVGKRLILPASWEEIYYRNEKYTLL